MLRAFKVNSVDYLMKPVEEVPLGEAVKKFKLLFFIDRVINNKLKQLFNDLDTGFKDRFLSKPIDD